MLLVRLAWKNVWRKKSRSLVVIGAVTLGTIAGVFVAGLLKGWTDQRVRSAIYTEVSHLKIRHPEYLNNEDLRFRIEHPEKMITYLDTCAAVQAYSCRSNIMAMATTARGSAALKLNGVEVGREIKTCRLNTQLVAGTYLSASFPNAIVISDKTAEQLRIKYFRITQDDFDSLTTLIGDTTVLNQLAPLIDQTFYAKAKFTETCNPLLTASQRKKWGPVLTRLATTYKLNAKMVVSFTALNGDMVYQSYKVTGIFKTSNLMFDQMNGFVRYDDVAALAGFDDHFYHEIAIILNPNTTYEQPEQVQERLQAQWPELSLMNWKQLAPDAGMTADFIGIYYYMVMGIIFFALAFGIINTMLMAILERIKELGMLMAIGMQKRRVYYMITLETLFLTSVGSILGMLIGASLIHITSKTGLNFSSVAEGFESVGWSAQVYPDITLGFFFGISLMVLVVSILSSILPARKAVSIKPIEAIRID